MPFSIRLFLRSLPVLFAVAACSSSEDESSIPAGVYSLPGQALMRVDERGDFSWTEETCGDWLHDSGGSFEREPDGSIRVYACRTHVEGGAQWAPDVAATKLTARVTPSGFAIDGVQKGDRPFTQEWIRSDGACNHQCRCGVPDRTGC